MIPRIYAYLILAVLIGVGAFLIRWHYINLGKQECQLSVNRAIAQQQSIADQNAEVYQAQQTKTRIEYRTRVKEIVKNVPVNHACDLSPSNVKLLNDAINSANTSR